MKGRQQAATALKARDGGWGARKHGKQASECLYEGTNKQEHMPPKTTTLGLNRPKWGTGTG